MAVLFSNNASTTLAASITNVATTLTVATGTGALFPAITGSDFFYVTLVNSSNQIEIVRVTARSTDTFTIVRGQEGTTARAYSTGDKVELRVTAAGLTNKLDKDGGTMTGKLTTATSATGGAGLNVPHGTAPTSPVNGDMWTTTAGLFARINNVTLQFSTAPMVYPGAGIAVSTGSAWGTSLTAPTGAIVGTTDTQTLTNKTLTSPTINGGTFNAANTVSDTGTIATNSVGFRGVPLNQQTSAYTLALTDNGKQIYATAAAFAITVPLNSSVAFPIGATITVICEDAAKTITPAAGVTLVQAGTGGSTTGTRTIAIGGVATLVKVQTDRWYISGSGLS